MAQSSQPSWRLIDLTVILIEVVMVEIAPSTIAIVIKALPRLKSPPGGDPESSMFESKQW